MSDDIAASRRKLIAELSRVCETQAIIVNDDNVLHLHSLLKQSLHHLMLPEKAAMAVIIAHLHVAAEILEREYGPNG